MASPVVEEAIESSTNTAGTSHVVTLPTATAGQLLLIILDKGSTAATINAHGSLTELLDENSANGLYIAYRWMDGTEPASYTLTSSANTRSARIAYRISGAMNPAVNPPEIGTTSSGSSATPDPPASATPGSSKDYLFIAFYGAALEEADDDTWSDTPPTNYSPTPPRQKACGTAGTNLGGMIAAAERALTTGSAENPGTFAKDVSAAWRAQTIMIHPSNPQSVTPTNASLSISTFAPTVTATQNQLVTPEPAALTLSTLAPSVVVNNRVFPSNATLTITTFAPTVTVGSSGTTVTPGNASLTLTTFAPTVSLSDNKLVTPSAASLALSAFAPTITISDHKSVTPGNASLSLTTFAPTVTASDHKVVTPTPAILTITGLAPVISSSTPQIIFQASGISHLTDVSGDLGPLTPASVIAGDILIAHVFYEGTTFGPSTPSGWTLLFGPITYGSNSGRHWIFGKVGDGTEDFVTINFGNAGPTTDRGARIYSYRNRVSGTIDQLVRGLSTSNADAVSAIPMPAVTTIHASGRAVAYSVATEQLVFPAPAGETGGDWVNSVGANSDANVGTIGVHHANDMARPGSISGGDMATGTVTGGVIGFEITPEPTASATLRTSGMGASQSVRRLMRRRSR